MSSILPSSIYAYTHAPFWQAVGTASAYSARVQEADDILFVPPGGDASRLRIAFAVLTLGTNITAAFLTALKAW